MELNTHPADMGTVPIVGETWDVEGPREIPVHHHACGQLISTEQGCVRVEAEGMTFISPPNRAVWMPPKVSHSASYTKHVAFRGLFFSPALSDQLPVKPAVFQTDLLTREIIKEIASQEWDYPEDGPEARLVGVLMDRLIVSDNAPLFLPKGRNPAVQKVMKVLEANPSDGRSLREWADFAHVSERTLARRFVADTSLSFTAWRNQLKMIHAVEQLALGHSVTTVAIDLGYANPSSFTTVFKKSLGVAPSAYFG